MPTFELTAPAGGDKTEYSIIPDGEILNAELVKIEEQVKPWKDSDGKDIVRLNFTFLIKGGEYEGRKVWGDTSTSFVNHPDCRLRCWAQELIGQELPEGFRLNTDALVGERCRVVVGVREWTDKNTQEQKQKNYVRDVMHVAGFSAAESDPF